MAKMKWEGDIDWKGLNDEEYEEGQDFDEYEGEVPPKNTLLSGDIKKAWLAESQSGNMMFKVLFVADGNEGEKKQYNGLPIWDNINFTLPQVKFKWQPWLDALGITLKDIKMKTIVGEEESMGVVVDKIGSVEFPARVAVKTDVERKGEYKGDARLGKWLPPVDSADEEDDDYDEDDEESF